MHTPSHGNATAITLVIILIVIAIAIFFFFDQTDTPLDTEETKLEETVTEERGATVAESELRPTVVYTDSGFTPAVLSVNDGETVVFVNESSRPFQPASANHPTHTVYPHSGRNLCSRGAEGNFDSCVSIAPEDTWEFTFTEIGEWGYHDHLSAGHRGVIVVE